MQFKQCFKNYEQELIILRPLKQEIEQLYKIHSELEQYKVMYLELNSQ